MDMTLKISIDIEDLKKVLIKAHRQDKQYIYYYISAKQKHSFSLSKSKKNYFYKIGLCFKQQWLDNLEDNAVDDMKLEYLCNYYMKNIVQKLNVMI